MSAYGVRSGALAVALLALVCAGCGGSDGPVSGSQEPTTVPEGATTPTATTPPTVYRRVRDASGAISLELPVGWRDVLPKPSRYPGAHVLRSDAQAVLWAAADTAELDSGLKAPGVIIEASRSLGSSVLEPTGHVPRESGLWFFRHRPRLVLTRECPNARFDGLGAWASVRVAGVGKLRTPGARSDVPVAETGQLVQRTIGRFADFGVTATWLCPLQPRVVEILFLSRDRSTFVYMQFPLPGGEDGDRMARILGSLRLRTAKVPKPA